MNVEEGEAQQEQPLDGSPNMGHYQQESPGPQEEGDPMQDGGMGDYGRK